MSDRSSPQTVAQAARALGLSPHTIRRWIGARRLGVLRLGRAVRIPQSEIERVLESGFVPARRDASR
jgi:excisionase family DNA binding protein